MSSPTLAHRARLLCSAIGLGAVALVSVLAVWQFSAAAGNSTLPEQPTAVPMASPAPTGIRQIALTTRDLVYDPVGQRIYASLPSTAANGNSLVQIDPFAGTVGTPVPLGLEPGKLAISHRQRFGP